MLEEQALPGFQRTTLHLLQMYDVSDSIDLEAAGARLQHPTERMRPIQTRGANVDMPQLPLELSLGEIDIDFSPEPLHGRLHMRVYDLGILSFRLMLDLPETATWETCTELIAAMQPYPADVLAHFNGALKLARRRLGDALVKPNAIVRTEEYCILVVDGLVDGPPASQLARHPGLLQVALGERRPLSTAVQELATPLSYYADDLILLTWTSALVVEPDASAREDAIFLLEFANVQLLAFRSFDDQVDRDLARITPRISQLPRPAWFISPANARFLHEIHALIADTTSASARVENALKVTEDVYWNRVYTAALRVLRVGVWRTGIGDGLDVLRETAGLLDDEAEAARATVLEVLVLVLIMLELIVAVIGLRR